MNDIEFNLLLGQIENGNLPIGDGRLRPALERALDNVRRDGEIRGFVDQYADRDNIPIEASRLTERVRAAMANYVENLGLKPLTQARFDNNEYDELFGDAYRAAIFGVGRGSGDIGGGFVTPRSDSDFDLETFDTSDEQQVVRENLVAATALYKLYILGDQLGIFPLVNALILRRARGRLELPRGGAAQKLNDYKLLVRNSSVTAEDRSLLYKRVFNAGDGEILEGTIANEEFRDLFDTLMEKVTDFITKEQSNSSDRDDKISRTPIEEAIRNLQYNLSYFANDIDEDTLTLKEQFNLATSILNDDDVVAAVGVSRFRHSPSDSAIWSVIEKLSGEELKTSPNVWLWRTIGIEGGNILKYVANFEDSNDEEQFRAFLKSAEKWIIARGKTDDSDSHKSDDKDSGGDDFGDDTGDDSGSGSKDSGDDWDK